MEFFRIKHAIPFMRYALVFNVISVITFIIAVGSLSLIWNFNSFALVFVLTAGGPGGKTMLPMLFAYNEAFKYNHWGLAAAMGNVMVIVIAVFLLLYLRGQARARSAQ